ncbi:MAG: NFYB/HAP3 family transcription factor subunit [Candidatus Marsarchaeota archaeon]|nr:NFYB/HAP3 family transcription factor subunit [Candidatus Marsarchaeota archaeon]
MKDRVFSLYDIEDFLKEAGAERIHEKAVISLEEELENTVKELTAEAEVYANHAGRSKLIKQCDIAMAKGMKGQARLVGMRKVSKKRKVSEKQQTKAVLQALIQRQAEQSTPL